jgi:hypothetical protein
MIDWFKGKSTNQKPEVPRFFIATTVTKGFYYKMSPLDQYKCEYSKLQKR